MKKHILPLIFVSMCLITTPVYAANPVDAIIPVSCTAEGSTESFTVVIQGDSRFKASPESFELKMEKVKISPYLSIFLVIINIKFIRKREQKRIRNTTAVSIRQKFLLQKMKMEN